MRLQPLHLPESQLQEYPVRGAKIPPGRFPAGYQDLQAVQAELSVSINFHSMAPGHALLAYPRKWTAAAVLDPLWEGMASEH